MEHRHHHLKRTLALLLVDVHGDAAPVVAHRYRIVGIYTNLNVGTIPGQSLIYRVVHHLVNQMVQTLHPRVAYIHGRAFAHGLKPLEHLNAACTILRRARLYIFFRHIEPLICYC